MDIKNKLISKIETIHNDEIVEEIYEWVEALLAESTERKFSEDEINSVAEGYQEYNSGKLYTEVEAQKLFKEWLSSKGK
jgi:hypothetical protein